MRIFDNIFPNSQRSPRSTPTGVPSNSSIRYKWPPRRKRTRASKNNSDNDFVGLHRVATSPSGLELCCPICACDVETLYQLSKCGHQACLYCWRGFVTFKVSSFAMAQMNCLACDQRLSRTLVLSLLRPPIDTSTTPVSSLSGRTDAERIYQRYEDFLLYQCLSKDKHARWCPNRCGYAVLAHGFRACPRLECQHPNCNGAAFCYKCRGPWNSADENSDGGSPLSQFTLDADAKHKCLRNTSGTDAEGAGDRSIFSWLRQLFHLPDINYTEGAPAVPYGATATGTTNYTIVGADPATGKRPSSSSVGLMRTLSPHTSVANTVVVSNPQANCSSDSADEVEPEVNKSSGEVDISNIELNLPGEAVGQVKPCPRCKTYLLKLDDGSCNHMSCFICGCEFCWLCLREVRGTHYLSPSGCTFWGRQQWPFRRRVCVMLITAFGTPFLLSLLVAIAIPGIIIGFPVYLAHHVAHKPSNPVKWKRILTSTLSFFGGLLFSPILAGLMAFLGIPLVLAYVYIFMPLSLFSSHRMSAASRPKQQEPVDPDIGKNINWKNISDSLP